eukprot:300565_1
MFKVGDVVEYNSDPDDTVDHSSHVHVGTIMEKNNKKKQIKIKLKGDCQCINYFLDEIQINSINSSVNNSNSNVISTNWIKNIGSNAYNLIENIGSNAYNAYERYGHFSYYAKQNLFDENLCTVISNCLVLCIGICKYDNAPNRIGNEQDIKNIVNTFGKNGYNYKIIKNKNTYVTLSYFNELIQEARTELLQHDTYDGFLFFISSHGKHDPNSNDGSIISTSDGQGISVNSILSNFRNEKQKGLGNKFVRKPKIFVVEACRGYQPSTNKNDKDIRVNQETYPSILGPHGKNYYNPDADILLIQSSTNGYDSYRNERTGSFLITETTKALSKSNRFISFDYVIHEIRKQVIKDAEESKYLEMVQTTATCVRQIYFNAMFIESFGEQAVNLM